MAHVPATTCYPEIKFQFAQCSDTYLVDDPRHEQELRAVKYQQWPATDMSIDSSGGVLRIHQHANPSCQGPLQYIVYTYQDGISDHTYGLVMYVRSDQDIWPLRNYMAFLILRNASALPRGSKQPSDDDLAVAESITAIFEARLLVDACKYEHWQRTGRALFIAKALTFISRRQKVELVLPAFPCKTTNPDKASSSLPDGAEYEALETLLGFCREVGQVYEHACHLTIVSDGHVFSDCQGTDDEAVTRYNESLQQMLHRAAARISAQQDSITLVNLRQLLMPAEASSLLSQIPAHMLPPPYHPVKTQLSVDDDLARTLLLSTLGPPAPFYRSLIKRLPDHPITTLWRGFSRFMFEDLAHLGRQPGHLASSSKRKKLAHGVAYEMLQRNQSYSRLVELLLPAHIRLSIHAHNNAGPKFAVNLVHLRPIQDASELAAHGTQRVSHDHGHVPTPWHNCVVDARTEDSSWSTMLCKAKVVIDALNRPKADWVGGYDSEHRRGGRWVIVWVGSQRANLVSQAY